MFTIFKDDVMSTLLEYSQKVVNADDPYRMEYILGQCITEIEFHLIDAEGMVKELEELDKS